MSNYDDNNWINQSSEADSFTYDDEDYAYMAERERRKKAVKKRRTVIAIIIASVLIISVGAVFIVPAIINAKNSIPEVTETPVKTPAPVTNATALPSPSVNILVTPSPEPVFIENSPFAEPLRYYFTSLSTDEKGQYNTIKKAISEFRPSVEFSTTSTKRIMEIAQYIFYDYPEYFWFDGSVKIEYASVGNIYTGDLYFDYTCSEVEKATMQQELTASTTDILNKLSKLSDYDKVKTAYEYIINKSKYDDRVLEQGCYPVLVRGRGVCSSYTCALNYLLGKTGIKTIYAAGISEGVDHAWSLVNLDNEWYQVDVTWGDPTALDGHDELSYDYLLLNDAEMLKNHKYDNPGFYPPCNATKYNYYRYEGLYLETYDYDKLLSILNTCRRNGTKFIFKCSNLVVFKETEYNLFKKDVAWKLFDDAGIGNVYTTIEYYTDPDALTISINI